MPIKNSFSAQVPFLESYTPFAIEENLQVIDNINDMISCEILSNTAPVEVSYNTGAEMSYTDRFRLKNLTTAVTIEVTISFDNQVFIIHEEGTFAEGKTPLKFNILPEQTRQFIILTNNISLNSKQPNFTTLSNIEITFKNISNGSFVSKRVSTSSLLERTFPTNITVK